MKVMQQVAAAMAAGSVAAQSASQYGNESVSFVTMTVDDCPTAAIETMITITNGVTVTYCPSCHHDSSSLPSPPTTTPTGPKHTTVYTTTYMSLCPTGTVPATYTVTEECDDEVPTWTPGPSHVPNGFTVTVKECTACDKDGKTVPVTITEPCDCEATKGTSLGPKPTTPVSNGASKPSGTPIGQIPDGQIQNPGPVPTPGSSQPAATCPGGTACPGSTGNVHTGPSASNSSVPPYPTGATTAVCPGPQCEATSGSTGGVPVPAGDAPAPSSTQTVPVPYEGGAVASYGVFGSAAAAVVVAGLAFAL